MKKLSLLIIALLIQCIVFSQEKNDISNQTIPDFNKSNFEVLMRGDTIIVLDSSVTYNYDAENMRPVIKTWFKTYDDQGRRIVKLNYGWDIEQEIFYELNYDSTVYYDDNTVKELITMTFDRSENRWFRSNYKLNNTAGLPLFEEQMLWDHNIGEYVYTSQYIKTYADELFMTSNQTNLYDNNNNEWYNLTKDEYLLNEDNQVVERKTSKYDTISDVWVNSTLYKSFFDENGNDTLKRKDIWNLESNLWLPEFKNQRSFNDDNQLTFDLQWEMDDMGNWIFDNKMEIIYSPQGDEDTVSRSKYYSEYEFWYFTNRQCFEYNNDHIITNVHTQNYDFVQEKWNNEYRAEWQYENNIIEFYQREVWRSNAWRNDEKTQYSYNETGILDTLTTFRSSGSSDDWDYGVRQSLVFNEDGNRELFHYEMINVENEWETVRKGFYYYSAFIFPNAISEIDNLEFTIYPNPTKGKLSIEFAEGFEENTIVFINDINGRTIKTVPISYENKLIDLSGQPTGVYFIQVLNGTKTGTQKIILK